MSLPGFVTSEAENDVEAGRIWYEDQESGLGKEFVREALAVFDRIGEFPRLFASVHSSIRRAGLNRFKFSAYYRIHDDYVELVGVIHDRRDLVNILKRL